MSWSLLFQIIIFMMFLLIFVGVALSIYKDFRVAMDARRIANQDIYNSNKNSEE